MTDALYNLENPTPLNFLELHLKEMGYICYAMVLTVSSIDIQSQIASCNTNADKRIGLEIVMTQNQWVTRFWMRTKSIAAAKGEINLPDDGPSIPLVRRSSSTPPPLPSKSPSEAASSSQTETKNPLGSQESEKESRLAITIPAPSDHPLALDNSTRKSGWHEPGSIPPPEQTEVDTNLHGEEGLSVHDRITSVNHEPPGEMTPLMPSASLAPSDQSTNDGKTIPSDPPDDGHPLNSTMPAQSPFHATQEGESSSTTNAIRPPPLSESALFEMKPGEIDPPPLSDPALLVDENELIV